MIDLVFLGTGCMQPTKERNHPAVAVRYESELLLFDCGEGTQKQLRAAGLKPAKITKLFLTHWHGDHSYGIPGVLSAMAVDGCSHTLQIYGPKGTKKRLAWMKKTFATKDTVPLEIIEIKDEKEFIFEKYTIVAKEVDHTIECIGYRFEEKEKRHIDVAKAKKLELAGPILGQLQKGEIVIHNNKKITPKQVTLTTPGKIISYITDTRPCAAAKKLAKNCDLLIIESTHLDEIKATTKQYKHMTVKEAATLATKAKVKELILTHISQRYKEDKELLKEAQKNFKNPVTIAYDLMKVTVK